MTTPADVQEAHQSAQRRRYANLRFVKIQEEGASPEDLALARKVVGAASPADLDKLLGTKPVTSLYCRGVIYIGERV